LIIGDPTDPYHFCGKLPPLEYAETMCKKNNKPLYFLLSASLAALICAPLPTLAQAPDKRSQTAVRIEAPPVLDGDVRNDPVWQAITPSGGFSQTTPNEGEPASQRTEVRVAYTEDTIYFSFISYDDDPTTIVVSDARRDVSLDETDSVLLILDTYQDEQNGFVFGTNPAAREYDGQLVRAGDGGSFGSGMGAGGGFNINWDGVWAVRTELGDYGWSAEFSIPFKTLRYPKKDVQSWGVNYQRNIVRRNENAYWAPLGRQFNLLRLADAGELTDLEIGRQRNLKIVPYVLGELSDVGEKGRDTDAEAGIDIKYSLTPSLTLDLTYNTDFAQVEADESQVSLDRFNIFFPEKRPFFLENSGLFTAGKSQRVELFFSRRIGLSRNGDIIPIDYGARVSGGIGGGFNLGMMYMQTDELDGIIPANRFGVARLNKELPNRSSLGAIFVSRDATGRQSDLPDNNRTYGIDGRWGIGEYGLVSGFVAKTSTPGLDGKDQSWSLTGDYDSEDWNLSAGYLDVGEHFNPEVGFLNRSGGYRNKSARALRRYRPQTSRIGLLEIRPHVSYNGYWNQDGFQQTGFLHVDNHLVWKNGYELHTAVNFTTEGLLRPYEIYPDIFVPPGTYRNSEVHLYAQTNPGAWVSFALSSTIGGFYNGDRVAFSPSMNMRVGEHFSTELSWIQNNVDLPQGDFTTQVGRWRLSWSFTPKVALEALLQYNNVDDYFSSNLRFSWLRKANTGLYVVYNDIRGYDRFTGEQPNRSLIVKYTHMFDLF
jgi:hypothetical protein